MGSATFKPRRWVVHLHAAAYGLATSGARAAESLQPAEVSAALGPWIFASVALVMVGALAYLAGRRSAASSQANRHVAGEVHQGPASPPQEQAAKGLESGEHSKAPAVGAALDEASAPTAAEEVRAFSYTVSHDLRAPLRVVDGFARILKEDYGRQLDRIGNDHLDRVLGACARMNAMIDAVLTLANLSAQPLARQPVDLSQLARFIVEDLHRAAPGREVHVEIEPGLKTMGDPTLLRQALENLLSNAWKYTGRCESPAIGFRGLVIDGRPCFEVEDNGAGFDMRSAERLFGLFQRLHSASDFPGTGVGLASVRRIIQRHGGDIWAESQPGQGARFRFTISPESHPTPP